MLDRAIAPSATDGEPSSFVPVLGDASTGLTRYLVDKGVIQDSGAPILTEESLAILRSCAAPSGSAARRTGLVCGYVQSGKTLSMEMVSALAKDNGFRMVILIAGVTTNLLDQSVDRMSSHLRGGAGGYEWVMLANPRERAHGQLESLLQEWRYQAEDCRMLFVTVMKNVHHLRPLTSLLQGVNLRGVPALLFDDEADQASPNTRPSEPHPSPVYAAIEELRTALPHHTYLQYTATPQAPLLISRIDSLSADFAELVSPGEGYVGGNDFFKRRAQLVATIPHIEIFDQATLPAEPPPSLIFALQVFFVGVAARYAQDRSPTGSRSMLIHPHQRREVHHAYLRWVETLKADWVNTLLASVDPDYPELRDEFERAHAELSTTAQDLPSFEAILERLPTAMGRAIPTLVNSDNGREIPWANGYAHILVGGEKLGRGYTVKGLTVTYMPRGPGGWTADTIQQRARFFGYHARPNNNYIDYCRVYLHEDVAQVYRAYIEHEEDVRAQIRGHRGRPLQELKRSFFLDGQLRPTRHNVMRQLYRRPRLRTGWFEQRAPHAAPRRGESNLKLVDALRSSVHFKVDEHERHRYADVVLRDLLERFLIPFACPDERDEIPMCAVRLVLADEADRREASPCRVILMEDCRAQPRERSLIDDQIDLLQGVSSSESPGAYPGDRHISANANDRVTVQVHIIKIVRKGTDATGREIITGIVAPRAPALAIALPPHLARDVIVQPSH